MIEREVNAIFRSLAEEPGSIIRLQIYYYNACAQLAYEIRHRNGVLGTPNVIKNPQPLSNVH